LFLLIRWAQRARCQAETPLIVSFRFLRPALSSTCSGAIVEFIVAVTQRALTPGWAMLSPGGGIGIFGSLERIAPVSRWT
jgi:hypothetical protein